METREPSTAGSTGFVALQGSVTAASDSIVTYVGGE